MGLEKAKSLLEVKPGKTFLDLIAEQVKYTRQKYGSQASLRMTQTYHGILQRPLDVIYNRNAC